MKDILNLIIYAPLPCSDTGNLIDALFRQTLDSLNIFLCCGQSNTITDSIIKSYQGSDRFHFILQNEEDADLADTVNRALLLIEDGFVQILDSFVLPINDSVYEEAMTFVTDGSFLILEDGITKNQLSDSCIFSCRLFHDSFDGIFKMDNLPLPIASYIWLLKLLLLTEPHKVTFKLLIRNAPQEGFKPDKNFYYPEYTDRIDDILNSVSRIRPEIFEQVLKELFILEARLYFITCLSGYEVLKGHLSQHIENYYNIQLAPEDITDYLYREYAITENVLKTSRTNLRSAEHFRWMYDKESVLHKKELEAKDKEISGKDKEISYKDRLISERDQKISYRDQKISYRDKKLAEKEKEARHFEWLYNKEHALYVKEQKRFNKELSYKEKEARHFEWLFKKETAAKLKIEKQNAQLSEKLDTAEKRLSLKLVRVALKIHSFFRRFRKH